ncbi:MAG: hypothetical protein ACXWLH_01575 [Candidatus Saccharimonadales bacterium]
MSEETKKDLTLPPVSVDIKLGKELENIDVDQEAIARHMLAEGATPEQVAATPIEITSRPSHIRRNWQGSYNQRTNQIKVGINDNWVTETRGVQFDKSKAASANADETMLHELQHRIDDIKGNLYEDNLDYAVTRRKTKPKRQHIAQAVLFGTGTDLVIEGLSNYPAIAGLFAASALYLVAKNIKSAEPTYRNHPSEIRAREHTAKSKQKFISVQYSK